MDKPMGAKRGQVAFWVTRKDQKRAGLGEDEATACFIYCAVKRRIKIETGPSDRWQKLTRIVAGHPTEQWVDLPVPIRHDLMWEVFVNPEFAPPLGYSVFPKTQEWQDLHSAVPLPLPAGDLFSLAEYTRQIAAYQRQGRTIVALDTTSKKNINYAMRAVSRLDTTVKEQDWELECDLPEAMPDIRKYLCKKAASEGKAQRDTAMRFSVRAIGRKEKNNTLYPEHEFRAWEVFAEFEEFDKSGKLGTLISSVRL